MFFRKREHSMTLSECADSLFRDIKDIDCVLGESAAGISDTSFIVNETDKLESDMSDEEIDVVSDCDASSSSSSTISAYSTGSMGSSASASFNYNSQRAKLPSRAMVGPGRSLLRNSRLNQAQQPVAKGSSSSQHHPRFQAQPSPQTILDHMNGDHCYFALRQEDVEMHRSGSPNGLLTPNESSDDEEIQQSKLMASSTTTTQLPRRLQQHHRESSSQDANRPVKFKFRMKFRSKSPQKSVQGHPGEQGQRAGTKRKSAIRNTHCPSPVKVRKTDAQHQPQVRGQAAVTISNSSKKQQGRLQAANFAHLSQEQKCREIRDLHNSMERQRRVDLRNNFEQLKEVVPELREAEKASKLNILNKSADYCRTLGSLEQKLIREKERESARQVLLRRKLQHLMRL